MYYYSKKIPVVGDIVFVNIKNFSSNGAYCNLIEYNNIEGFILNTELDKYVKSSNKQFEYNKIYPTLVISVTDKSVDLSYKKIKSYEREKLLNHFNYIKKIIKIIRECVFFTKLDENIVCELIMWKLFNGNTLESADNTYLQILKNPGILLMYAKEYFDQINSFVENLSSRITVSNIVINQIFELIIYDTNALEKLKQILSYPHIKYIASPKYQIVITGNTMDDCDVQINKFSEYILPETSKYKCIFKMLDKQIVKDQEYFCKPLNIDFIDT